MQSFSSEKHNKQIEQVMGDSTQLQMQKTLLLLIHRVQPKTGERVILLFLRFHGYIQTIC